MKGKITRQRLFGVFVVLLSCLFGCSSSQKPDFRIGIDPTFYPLNLDKKDINVFAFFNELFQEMAKTNKRTISSVNRSWDDLLNGLETNSYEAVVSSMQPRVLNENTYLFSDVILPTGPVIIVPTQSTITGYKDLNDKIVAVEEGSEAALKISRDISISVRMYKAIPQALTDLEMGKYDAVIVDIIPAISYVQDLYSGSLKIVGDPILPQGLRIVSLKGSSKTVDFFNQSMRQLKEKGVYRQLAKKWNVGI
ncbi:MAG: transporter substrate-binding domain-containing protein [Chlamydiales bacterium]|nr:transporter substrate-binding domain-containing protein [Chlamydiales bacterium]